MAMLGMAKESRGRTNYSVVQYMSTDNFAYIGAYRKCIDELGLLKKEIWNILMDPNTTKETKILATKELHSLCKTYTLLIKDLPFITNLSKYYDQDMLNSSYANSLHLKGTYSNKNCLDTDRNPIERIDTDKPENPDNPFAFSILKDDIKESNALEDINCESPNKHKQVDDKIIETMQAQLNYGDNGISKDHLESIKRLKEIFDD